MTTFTGPVPISLPQPGYVTTSQAKTPEQATQDLMQSLQQNFTATFIDTTDGRTIPPNELLLPGRVYAVNLAYLV